MKLTAILLLATGIQLNAAGYGQTISCSAKDAPVEKVFKEVKEQSDYCTTNIERRFTLQDSNENAKLIAIEYLDEGQVIAYGTSTKRSIIENAAIVKAKEIEKQPIQYPLLELQGRLTTVIIQGRNSIEIDLKPLTVIDGAPSQDLLMSVDVEAIEHGGIPLHYVNPSNIESIYATTFLPLPIKKFKFPPKA